MANATANLTHSNNVYNATNLCFTTTVTAQGSDASDVADWLAELASVNQYAIQKETYEKVAPGTCKWILEEPKFDAWMSQNNGTFWGAGMPGAGKTTLTSFVVHHLQQRPKTPDAEAVQVAFIYCRFSDSLSVSNVLASILQQLVNKSDSARSKVQGTLFTKCKQERTRPTQSELESTLRSVVSGYPQMFIIIDALDELQEVVREDIMALLVSLERSMFATSRELDLPILVSPDIRIEAPKRDFEAFITQEIQRLPKLRSILEKRKEVLAEVVEHIQSKSDGMFLLSALQVSALGGVTTIKNLRKAIQDLPTSLADMYNLTMKRIMAQGKEERTLALCALLWVTYATRPLKAPELLAALAVEPDSTELDPDALTDERNLVSACCGLLSINEETGVRLIHYTTHDFFMRQAVWPFNDPHGFAATICGVYRSLSGIDTVENVDRFSLQGLAKENPFIEYAVMNLGHHTYQSTLRSGGKLPPYVERLLSSQSSILVSSEKLWPDMLYINNFDSCNPTHFVALHGLSSWFEEASNAASFHELSGHKRTPLIYACAGGQARIVKLLLETGDVDVNHEDSFGFTALCSAVSGGSNEVVELLLKSGAFVRGGTLQIASQCGHVEIARNLLNHLDIGSHEDNVLQANKALHTATSAGHIEVVRLLLAYPGIDINLPLAGNGNYLLIKAIVGRQIPIAKLLLDLPGIDYNVQDEHETTALHWAVLLDVDEIVEILLKLPSLDINARNNGGSTALHCACMNGSVKSLHLLIQSGEMDINARNDCQWTPLHYAAYWGWQDCVEMLLNRCPKLDIDALTPDEPGCSADVGDLSTALDLAMQKGCPVIVMLLERAGAQSALEMYTGSC